MKIENRANFSINVVGLTLIVASVILKILERKLDIDLLKLVRILVFLLFYVLWAVTIERRVVQRNIRNNLMFVAILELFWIVIRSVKFELLTDVTTQRYAWYLYYLPMLMIPAICLLLSISMGKPENYRPRKFTMLFPLISLLLFLLVMTNDLHSAVFVIPWELGDLGIEVGYYSYGAGFFVVEAYIVLCILASYGIILVKCRKPNRRLMRFLPIVPLALGTIVSVLNAVGVTELFGFYRLDITVFLCFCTTATLEACIQSGLIPTNNGYDELFSMSGIRAVVTDDELCPLIFSDTYEEISPDDMKKALKAPVTLDNGCRLSGVKIKGGYVLRQDDISELNKVLSNLSETNDYLQGKSSAIQQAYDYQKKERRLIEKNRLYNRILANTKPEIERYAELIEQLAAETDPEREKLLAVRTAFVSAFIKRRDNLIFLSEVDELIDPHELAYCVEESLSNLRLGGAECSCSLAIEQPLAFDKISALYEGFYNVLFGLIGAITSVCVYLIEENGEAAVSMRISCVGDEDLSRLESGNIRVRKEENEWAVTICAAD